VQPFDPVAQTFQGSADRWVRAPNESCASNLFLHSLTRLR